MAMEQTGEHNPEPHLPPEATDHNPADKRNSRTTPVKLPRGINKLLIIITYFGAMGSMLLTCEIMAKYKLFPDINWLLLLGLLAITGTLGGKATLFIARRLLIYRLVAVMKKQQRRRRH